MTESEFRDLLSDAAINKTERFNIFFKNCYTACLPHLLKLTPSEDDARDAFMEAMFRFWQKLREGKVEFRNNLQGYVFTIAKNVWLEKQRKKSTSKPEYSYGRLDEEETESFLNSQKLNSVVDTSDHLVAKEEELNLMAQKEKRIKTLVAAMQKLGDKCKKLLTDTIVYKLKLKDIYQPMGYASYNAAKVAKHQCKKSLIRHFNRNAV